MSNGLRRVVVCLAFAFVAPQASAVDVQIDVVPWSDANQLNPAATANVAVAIFGMDTTAGDAENFDVTQVDDASVVFGPGNARSVYADGFITDFDRDGIPDIAFLFAIPDTGIVCGDAEAILSGATYSEVQFSGTDMLETIGCDRIVPVQFDIDAGGGSNQLDPLAAGNILVTLQGASRSNGDAENFDVTLVDPASVIFGPGNAPKVLSAPVEDVNGDSIPDMSFAFAISDTAIACGDTAVTLSGATIVGTQFSGSDVIETLCEDGCHPPVAKHAVIAHAGAGGAINPVAALVDAGTTAQLTVLSDADFVLDSVAGCGGALTENTYTTAPVTNACEITANFMPGLYSVTASSAGGGTISPASTTVSSGETVNFTLTPAPGYRVNTVDGCNGTLDGEVYTTGPVTTGTCVVDVSFAEIPVIEAYLSGFSVKQTDELELFVSTSLATYDVVVSRIAPFTEMARYVDVPGSLQPVVANAYEAGPAWVVSVEIDVPSEWPSGVYELLIEGLDQAQQLVQQRLNFIVRANSFSQSSKVLVVDNGLTTNAYNGWGGRSLYASSSQAGIPGVAVALKRPGNFLLDEELIEFANWAAAMGYSFEWAAGFDLHSIPALLDAYETIVIVGHSEYWSKNMRDAFDTHIANGGNALILGGNTMWLQVRIEGNSMVCYKNPVDDPLFNINNSLVTTRFFENPVLDPENRSIGVSWRHGGYINFGGFYPASDGWGGYMVANPEHDLLAATGLVAGEMFGQAATIAGYEVDGTIFDWVDGVAVTAGAGGTPDNFEIVAWAPAKSDYTNVEWLPPDEQGWEGAGTFGALQLPSGGRIINMATVDWADGLFAGGKAPNSRDGIADEQVSRITFNALRQLGHLPVMPGIKGRPVYRAGADLGIFVWKEFFDGPYHLVTNGGGTNEQFLLTVISSSEITNATSWGLSGSDSLVTGANWLELNSSVANSAEGVDFSVNGSGADDEIVVLGVMRQLGNGPFDIKLGMHREPAYASGWMLANSAIPALPSFIAGTDLGIFIGRDTPEAPLQIRWSSNGRTMPGSVEVLSSSVIVSASPSGLEVNDSLYVGANLVDAFGEVQSDADGIDITVVEAQSKLAVLASLDGLSQARLVNHGEFGMPDTVVLPPVTARGHPEYDPGQEAALRIWLDDSDTWQMHGSAGGGSGQYSGSIESSQPLSLLNLAGLQPTDAVILVNPNRIEFSISMSANGEAGFSFQTLPGSTLNIDLNEGPEALRIGAESWPVAGVPVDIAG